MTLVWQGPGNIVMKDKNANDNGGTSFVYSIHIAGLFEIPSDQELEISNGALNSSP
jgi:hypothetical protein